MTKLVNHVDHVAWIFRQENGAKAVKQLEEVFQVKFEGPSDTGMGHIVWVTWEAGLEVVSPLPEETAFNKRMHHWLATHGEGLYTVVFGVEGLDAHRNRLIAMGLKPSEQWSAAPLSRNGKSSDLQEFIVDDALLDSSIVFSEIDYSDDVIVIK